MAEDDPTRRATGDDEVEPDDAPTVRALAGGQLVFGRYVLHAIVGRGGMGVVWRARDEKLDREVALKFLPEAVRNDPDAVRELKHETRRCLELTHTNIVRVYDFVEDGAMTAISMEYVDGSSLAAWKAARPQGCASATELSPLVVQLCGALQYAHATARIVHRDLKPANLLLTRDGQLKITDFGIARSLAETRTRLTGTETTSGTPAYMSPQQLLGEHSEPADDIYALGATLYELLTSKPPFFSGNLAAQIREISPPRLSDRRQELGIKDGPVPEEWEATVLACLAKNAGDRPPTAANVVERLGLAPIPTDSRPSSPKVAVTPPQPGQRRLKIIAAAAMLALAAACLLFFYVPAQRRQAGLAERDHAAILAQIEGTPDSTPPAGVAATDQAVRNYLATAPERFKPDVTAAWAGRQAACAAYQISNALGKLVVRTTPAGADIQVGTLPPQKSPLTLKDQKPGRYPVRILLGGYDDWNGDAEIKAGGSPELNVSLVRSRGRLVIETEPAGLHFRMQGPDHAESGTGGSEAHDVPTGRYLVTVSRRGCADVTKYVEVKRNSTTDETIAVVTEISGTWSWALPGRGSAAGGAITLVVSYRDGRITGSATVTGRNGAADPSLTDLSFDNDRLVFSLVRDIQGSRIASRYSGRLDGNVIVGTVEVPGRGGQMVRRQWEARRLR